MMPRILFITAGGRHPEYSSGHISRCLVSARRILSASPEARFAFMMPEDEYGESLFVKEGFRPVIYRSQQEEKRLLARLIRDWDPHVLVLDRLDVDPEFARWLKHFERIMVSLDDGGAAVNFCDIAMNPLIPNPRSEYPGYSYLTLEELKRAPSIEKMKGEAAQCLISVGGYDADGLLGRLLRALGDLPGAGELKIHVFAGVEARQNAALRSALAGFDKASELHGYSGRFLEIMQSSDAAIVAGGLSMFESTRRGIPTLVISNKDHQKFNIQNLERAGAVLYGGDTSEIPGPRFAAAAGKLISDAARRRNLAENALEFWAGIPRVPSALDLIQIVTVGDRRQSAKRRSAVLWPKRLTPPMLSYAAMFAKHHKIDHIVPYAWQEHSKPSSKELLYASS